METMAHVENSNNEINRPVDRAMCRKHHDTRHSGFVTDEIHHFHNAGHMPLQVAAKMALVLLLCMCRCMWLLHECHTNRFLITIYILLLTVLSTLTWCRQLGTTPPPSTVPKRLASHAQVSHTGG